MVANDKKNLRLLGFISLSLIFFVIFLALFTTYLTPSDAPTGSERMYLVSTSILLVNGLFGLARARRWDKINYRRQVAAARELPSSVPFARPQPTPDPSALLPPCTIKLRPNWVWILLIPCLLLGLLFLLDLSIGLLVGLDLQIALGLVWFPSPIGFLTILLCIVFTIAILLPQRIEVTSVGITVRHARYDWGLRPVGTGSWNTE